MPPSDRPQRPVWIDSLCHNARVYLAGEWQPCSWFSGIFLMAVPCYLSQATDELEIPDPPPGHYVFLNISNVHAPCEYFLGHNGEWVPVIAAHSPILARKIGS